MVVKGSHSEERRRKRRSEPALSTRQRPTFNVQHKLIVPTILAGSGQVTYSTGQAYMVFILRWAQAVDAPSLDVLVDQSISLRRVVASATERYIIHGIYY